jgi:hypothetical protein
VSKKFILPFEVKHQMILPKGRVTTKLERDLHQDNGHAGAQVDVLARKG